MNVKCVWHAPANLGFHMQTLSGYCRASASAPPFVRLPKSQNSDFLSRLKLTLKTISAQRLVGQEHRKDGAAPIHAGQVSGSVSDRRMILITSPSIDTNNRDAYDEIVEVKVGPEEKTFTLHKNVICFYSGYFEKVFNGGFAEAKAKSVILPEEDVQNFKRCISWIYARRFAVNSQKSFRVLSEMWAFADRRDIPLMMNACVDAMRDEVVLSWKVPSLDLSYIYENTAPTSGLRRFAIHVIGATGNGSKLRTDSWNAEILKDMLMKVWPLDCSKMLNKKQVEDLDMCPYHHHEEGVKCPKKT